MKWEYMCEAADDCDLTATLEHAGNNEWELVEAIRVQGPRSIEWKLIFKRPKEKVEFDDDSWVE